MGVQRGLWISNTRNRIRSTFEIYCHIGLGFAWGKVVPKTSPGGFIIAA